MTPKITRDEVLARHGERDRLAGIVRQTEATLCEKVTALHAQRLMRLMRSHRIAESDVTARSVEANLNAHFETQKKQKTVRLYETELQEIFERAGLIERHLLAWKNRRLDTAAGGRALNTRPENFETLVRTTDRKLRARGVLRDACWFDDEIRRLTAEITPLTAPEFDTVVPAILPPVSRGTRTPAGKTRRGYGIKRSHKRRVS